ncbi:MAG: hypothetical protein HRU40_12095 [Saprospiraceae bacterium]|nr:hypothetical protein [Saprospiraceae bacterium]
MTKFVSFFICLSFTYLLFLLFGKAEEYQLYAVCAIGLNLLLWYLLYYKSNIKAEVNFLTKDKVKQIKKYEILLIQIGLVAFSILNLYIVTEQTNFDPLNQALEFDFKSFTTYTSIPLIIGAQFGGWFYQTVLIFLFLEILLQEVKFKKILKITGIAYLGFLTSAVVIAVLNIFYLENRTYELKEIEILLSNSILHIMIAKSGDFATSVLIAIGLYNHTNLNFAKSIVASFIPTVSLIAIILIFQHYIL